MHRIVRRWIFVAFFLLFVVGAPAVVLYTAGYRLNLTTLKVQQTGVIAISSSPKGANVTLNGVATGNKTPYVIPRLSSGNYTVTLSRDGYTTWEQSVRVSSGSTTFISTTLFARTSPTLLTESAAVAVVGDRNGRFVDLLLPIDPTTSTQKITRFDVVTHISRTLATLNVNFNAPYTTLSLSADESALILDNGTELAALDISTGLLLRGEALTLATNPLPNYSFVNSDMTTELRNITTLETVTLLPPSTYRVTFTNGSIALLQDTLGRAYLFSITQNSVRQIALPADIVALSHNEESLVGTDGNEIGIYTLGNQSATLIARQSERVIAVNWHSGDADILYATRNGIYAVAQEQYTTRIVTPLVTEAEIVNMWPESTGKRVTFFGTVNGVTGVWSVALTQ